MKTSDGRDPRNAFTQDVFSDYNNNMRLDMVQAAAGAWYGATSLQQRRKILTEQDYNEGLLRMFNGSEQTPRDPYFVMPTVKNPADLISAFSLWKKTMNPDAAYLYFESKLRP